MVISALKQAAGGVPNAADGNHLNLFIDSADGLLKGKDNTGTLHTIGGGGSSVGLLFKPADTSRTGGSFTIDPDLQIAVIANQRLTGKAILGTTGNDSGHVGFAAPAGSKLSFWVVGVAGSSVDDVLYGINVAGESLSSHTIDLTGSTGDPEILVEYVFINGANAGAFGVAFDGAGGTFALNEGSALIYSAA
jgi:hypothetical protein